MSSELGTELADLRFEALLLLLEAFQGGGQDDVLIEWPHDGPESHDEAVQARRGCQGRGRCHQGRRGPYAGFPMRPR